MIAHLIKRIKEDRCNYEIMCTDMCKIHDHCPDQIIIYNYCCCIHTKNMENDYRMIYCNENLGLEIFVYTSEAEVITEVIKYGNLIFGITYGIE